MWTISLDDKSREMVGNMTEVSFVCNGLTQPSILSAKMRRTLIYYINNTTANEILYCFCISTSVIFLVQVRIENQEWMCK